MIPKKEVEIIFEIIGNEQRLNIFTRFIIFSSLYIVLRCI